MKSIILIIIAFGLPLGILAQNYNEYLEAAQKHLRNGNYEKAEVAYNVYKQLTSKTDENFEMSLSKAKDMHLVPRNIGVPIKLDILGEASHAFLGNWHRRGNDTLGGVSVYINLKGEKYDQLKRINKEQLKDCLIGNVCKGDIITIISENSSFQPYSMVVTDSVITKQYLNVKVEKKRVSFSCKIIDKYTQNPIGNVLVGLNYVSYRDDVSPLYEIYTKTICETTTKTNGWFGFLNCISDYSYNIEITPPKGYYGDRSYSSTSNHIDIKPIENDSLTIELTPRLLKGIITDGKYPVTDAIIEYKSLYSSNCSVSNKGEFEIFGIMGDEITISAKGFKTLVLDVSHALFCQDDLESSYRHPIKIKLNKGDKKDIIKGEYNYHKDKIKKIK